jgi:hypothetical protein
VRSCLRGLASPADFTCSPFRTLPFWETHSFQYNNHDLHNLRDDNTSYLNLKTYRRQGLIDRSLMVLDFSSSPLMSLRLIHWHHNHGPRSTRWLSRVAWGIEKTDVVTEVDKNSPSRVKSMQYLLGCSVALKSPWVIEIPFLPQLPPIPWLRIAQDMFGIPNIPQF